MKFPYREKMYACIHPETYKYFFAKEQVAEIWKRLEKSYGSIRKNFSFQIMEIECETFFFRSTWGGNPVTVIRKRKCKKSDVEQFHALVGFL